MRPDEAWLQKMSKHAKQVTRTYELTLPTDKPIRFISAYLIDDGRRCLFKLQMRDNSYLLDQFLVPTGDEVRISFAEIQSDKKATIHVKCNMRQEEKRSIPFPIPSSYFDTGCGCGAASNPEAKFCEKCGKALLEHQNKFDAFSTKELFLFAQELLKGYAVLKPSELFDFNMKLRETSRQTPTVYLDEHGIFQFMRNNCKQTVEEGITFFSAEM